MDHPQFAIFSSMHTASVETPFSVILPAGFMAHIRRALPAVIAAGVPPRFYAQCAGAYVALSMAAVVLTRTELLLPLVHYRTQRAEVGASRFGTDLPTTIGIVQHQLVLAVRLTPCKVCKAHWNVQ